MIRAPRSASSSSLDRHEVERDQIGARFFERRVLFFERVCGLPFRRSAILPDAWPITSCML
jgi:hypothetical protein